MIRTTNNSTILGARGRVSVIGLLVVCSLGLLPVLVYYRDNLGVGERADLVPDLPLLVRQQIVDHVVVRPERTGDVGDQRSPPSPDFPNLTLTYYPCYYQF